MGKGKETMTESEKLLKESLGVSPEVIALVNRCEEELRDEFRRCFDTDRYMILSIGPFESD